MRLSTKGMHWNQEVGLSHAGCTIVKAFVRHHNKGKWCKTRILKKDLKINSQLYISSFPTAGGPGEKERESVNAFVLKIKQVE